MNGMNRELVLHTPSSTLDVDTEQSKARAAQILEQARAGSPAFPKDLTPAQAATLARITLRYGLDPLLDELIVYQGRPYLTIGGRERIANEHPQYDGMEGPRPATEEERIAFRCAEDEHLWIVNVWRKDRRFPSVGYGRAGGRLDPNPVGRQWGQELAQKRAKHRALRDAFSIPLPDRDELQAGPLGPVIDAETGEIEPSGPTLNQKARIHILAKEAGYTDDGYRDLLRESFGVESSLDLSEGQAAALVELLQARAAKPYLFEGRSPLEVLGADPDYDEIEPEPLPEPEPEPVPVPTDLLGEEVIDDPHDRRWQGWLTLAERVRGDPRCSDVEVKELTLPVHARDLADAIDSLRQAGNAARGVGR